MSHAKVYYSTGEPYGKRACVSGEIVLVDERWVTLIPDDESVTKMLIPCTCLPIVQYCPRPLHEHFVSWSGENCATCDKPEADHPARKECRLTDKQECTKCGFEFTTDENWDGDYKCPKCLALNTNHNKAPSSSKPDGYELAGSGKEFCSWCSFCRSVKDFTKEDKCSSCGTVWGSMKEK